MIWKCEKCGRRWYYPVEKCIFCKNDLKPILAAELTVKGVTEVLVPSPEHDCVPYYELLLEDEQNNLYIKKSFESYKIGDIISSNAVGLDVRRMKEQKTIGIIGTGIMGKQLTQFFAQAGYPVILRSRTEEELVVALKEIERRLSKNKSSLEVKEILKRIECTTDLSAFGSVDLIIESIYEDMDVKKKLLSDLSSVCSKDTVIATNTSSLPISELASVVVNPSRFIGMHFFNPVHKMHLIEVVYGKDTSQETTSYVVDISKKIGKTPIVVKDSPGFIVNRALMLFINEAASLLKEGVSPADVDVAIRLGLNHPMGPLALADLIGVDICLSIIETLYKNFKDKRYLPSPVLYEMVNKGHLGKKSGIGFYNYNA